MGNPWIRCANFSVGFLINFFHDIQKAEMTTFPSLFPEKRGKKSLLNFFIWGHSVLSIRKWTGLSNVDFSDLQRVGRTGNLYCVTFQCFDQLFPMWPWQWILDFIFKIGLFFTLKWTIAYQWHHSWTVLTLNCGMIISTKKNLIVEVWVPFHFLQYCIVELCWT